MSDQVLNVRVALSGVAAFASGLGDMSARVAAFSRSFAAITAGLVGVGSLSAGLAAVVKTGAGFNSTLEQARLGIAAIQKQLNPGAFKNFDEAMAVAGKAIDLLKEKAKESPATFEELVQAFQGVSGAASAAGISMGQQVELVVLMSQTLAGLGIRTEQILQESRALITGTINEDAMAARILGITGAQIAQQREAGKLYEFLTEKMSAFAEAGKRGSETFATMASNVKDAFQQAAGAATVPIFEVMKDLTKQILAVDWQSIGETIGDYIALGMREWKAGSFEQFVAVSLGAGFEAAVENLRNQLIFVLGLDEGVFHAIGNLATRLGFAIRGALIDAFELVMNAFTGGPIRAMAEQFHEAMRSAHELAKSDAFSAMNLGGIGTANRDALSAMLSGMKADREARERLAVVRDLPGITVHGDRGAGYSYDRAASPGFEQFDPNKVTHTMTSALVRMQAEWTSWATQIAKVFEDVFSSAVSSISNGISGLILQTKTWGQALREIGMSILTSVVNSIVQMGVRWVMTRIMMATVGRAIHASEIAAATGLTAAMSASLSGILAAPAALAATASFGSAAAQAPAAVAAAIAATKGVAAASAVPGFATGGLTPGRPTLAIVGEEGREFVMNNRATQQFLPILQAMNSGSTGAVRPVVSGQSSGVSQPQIHLYMDRDLWADATRDRTEAIAVDVFRRMRRT